MTEIPEGLTPGPDGSFYGEYRHVPGGWEVTCWAKSFTIVKDGVTGFSPDAIVRCWPPKPKWEAKGNTVVLPGQSMIYCYAVIPTGEGGLPNEHAELAVRVARLLNEDG